MGAWRLYDTSNHNVSGGVATGRPVPVVIKKKLIFSKTGIWEGAEQLLIQLAAFTLVTDNFLQLFVCHRLDANATVFREGTLDKSFLHRAWAQTTWPDLQKKTMCTGLRQKSREMYSRDT